MKSCVFRDQEELREVRSWWVKPLLLACISHRVSSRGRGDGCGYKARARQTRGHSVYYVEHTTERDVSTTPGMEDDCRDAGRLQGCRS